MVHKWANLALNLEVDAFRLNWKHKRIFVEIHCLQHSPKTKEEETKKEMQSRLAVTCSIRLRTAKAGRGKPWAEVALWTPPEIGVLKSPALVPPPAPLDWGCIGVFVFGDTAATLSSLSRWFKSPFRRQDMPLKLWSSHLIHPDIVYSWKI